MSYNIIPTEKFKKEAKRLAKKYPSIKEDLVELNEQLIRKPTSGTVLGNIESIFKQDQYRFC